MKVKLSGDSDGPVLLTSDSIGKVLLSSNSLSSVILSGEAPTPPLLLTCALLNATTIELEYDEVLDVNSIPALTDYILEYLLVDVDNNIYPEITIGNQVWIGENLKVEHYADGSSIPNITDNSLWAADTAGAMCYYNNDISNKAIYGALYNWHAVNNAAGLAKLTRNGVDQLYRVPTKTDFDNLFIELGGTSVAGGKLKESGLAHWLTPNTGADNSSGFTALPGGYKDYNINSFYFIRERMLLWSSTINTVFAWFLRTMFDSANVSISYTYKGYGFSVRLVKDI